jgi:hypothetical protein
VSHTSDTKLQHTCSSEGKKSQHGMGIAANKTHRTCTRLPRRMGRRSFLQESPQRVHQEQKPLALSIKTRKLREQYRTK